MSAGFKNYEPKSDMTTLITGTTEDLIDDNGGADLISSAMKLGDLGFPHFEVEIDLDSGGTTNDLRITIDVSVDGGTTYSADPESWAIVDVAGAANINKVLQFTDVAGTHVIVTAASTGGTDTWKGTIKARRYRYSQTRAAPSGV